VVCEYTFVGTRGCGKRFWLMWLFLIFIVFHSKMITTIPSSTIWIVKVARNTSTKT
jgi:hypothetical protein